MIEVFVGFHAPYFRNLKGHVDPRGWFGHVEAWAYTKDETWIFLDPQAKGFRILVTHHHDDVLDQLAARYDLCETILKLPMQERDFRIPLHGPMTCAAILGAILGHRALFPSGLRRKLLANGAEVVKHGTEGKSEGQGCAAP